MQTITNIDPIFLFVMVDGGGGVRRSGMRLQSQSAPLEVPLVPIIATWKLWSVSISVCQLVGGAGDGRSEAD
jgi:hypothetical protein